MKIGGTTRINGIRQTPGHMTGTIVETAGNQITQQDGTKSLSVNTDLVI